MVQVKAHTAPHWMTIGEVAERSGVATSALRFYERKGLLRSSRSASGHRRYAPEALRRVAFVRVAQRVGMGLAEVRAALDSLPDERTPTRRDWNRVSRQWRGALDERIALLEALRDQLDSCIGCGCLSLSTCGLYNPQDRAAALGQGPRYLLGDRPADAARRVPAPPP